ncbi:MAG: hypothetical protein M4579_000707 [Chaenotheca gracillima]|nr:MAG: hypothetical protein M4579_000707 [Chaenotheca gracillima]
MAPGGILRLVCAALGVLLLPLVRAQGADFSVPSEYTQWDNEKWVLSTDQLIQAQYQSRLTLANGYFGCSFAAAGPFFEADANLTDPKGPVPLNGWPMFDPRLTFCSIVGFWDLQPNTTMTNFPWLLQYGGESVISGVPHWGALVFETGGKYLDAVVSNKTVSNFKSSLSAKDGIAQWSYTWSPNGSKKATFDVSYTLFISRERYNAAAVRLDIIPSEDATGTITDILDGRSSVRSTAVIQSMDKSTNSIYSAVHPDGISNVTAYVLSSLSGSGIESGSGTLAHDQPWLSTNDSTIGQVYDVSLKAGQTSTFYKYVGAASADAFANPQEVARNASSSAQTAGWSKLIAEHQAAWAEIFPSSSVDNYSTPDGSLPDDPNIKDLQISSVLTPFYLLMNTLRGDAGKSLDDNSISVGGIGAEPYGGLVFWDADTFMSPGLVAAFPEYARTIANYRIAKAPQAHANAVFNNLSESAVLFSWTSGRFGNCTGTGPCADYEYHINGDIAEMLLQHRNVTGDESWWREQAWPVYEAVAQTFSELLKYNETTKKYDIYNMTDPDEYANGVNNGAFTLQLASKTLTTANSFRALYGMDVNDTWTKIANNVAVPYDPSGITSEYEGMNNSVPVKQADVVLGTYPLNYQENYTTQQSLNDLDYYATKQSADGPAMTFSIFSIIANQVTETGCSAYTYALDAFQPYTRAPWYQFSEQLIDDPTINGGTNPAFPFLTGHGGFNQVGLFGWLGLRTDLENLLIDPSLPPQIPNVKLRTFFYSGATLNAELNYTHTTISRSKTENTFVNDTYGSDPMPIMVGRTDTKTHSLSIGDSITVENRQTAYKLTTSANLVQCKAVTSSDKYAQGQYPVAAIDGAISTKWQPSTPDRASMMVNMEDVPFQPVLGVSFNWGLSPPKNAEVILTNYSSLQGPAVIIPITGIKISLPFDAKSVTLAQPLGNTTNVSIANAEPIYTGKYAMLQIEGTQGEVNTTGGTVAEFALIGKGGEKMVKKWTTVKPRRR